MTLDPRAKGASAPGVSLPEAYVGWLLVGMVVVQVSRLVMLASDAGSGESPAAITVDAILTAAAALAGILPWWRYRATGVRPATLVAFAAIVSTMWILSIVLGRVRGEMTSAGVFLLPILLVLIVLKPPTLRGAIRSAEIFAWSLVAASAITLILEVVGFLPSWYLIDADLAYAAGERGSYWLPLAGPLGLDGRWAGPFLHPNLAGPVGAFLLVFGVTRRGLAAWLLSFAGAAILLLAGSRTSMLSAAAGLSVLAGAWWLRRPSRAKPWLRLAVAATPLAALAAVWVISNPGLTGRQSIWPVFLGLWREQPLLGGGAPGISQAIADGDLPGWASHAHSIVLDPLARTGIVGFLLAAAAFVVALAVGFASVRRNQGLGLALTLMVLVGGAAETTVTWRVLGNPLAVLILAVLVSTARDPDESTGRAPAENSSRMHA